MSTDNGLTNGSGVTNGDHLAAIEQAYAHYVSVTAAIADVISLLRAAPGATVPAAAPAPEPALTPRRGGRPKRKPAPANEPAAFVSATAQRRQRTADFLAQFDQTDPIAVDDGGAHGLGTLVRHGYLKKKGDGWVRTAQEYRA